MRWKKAALENCPGIPCITNTVPGAPTGVVATVGAASASVAFTAPSSTGGSAITGYTVTSSPGSYTSTGTSSPIIITGLINGTAYIFTVIATNAVGNSAASAASTAVTPAAVFVCGTSTITDVDNNSYNTVLIGAQCWTKQNLRVTKYNDNMPITFDATETNPIPPATQTTWRQRSSGAYTIYDNTGILSANATNYGFLYNWYAATDSRKICPDGWHVPTNLDWYKMINFVVPAYDTLVSHTALSGAGELMLSSSFWLTSVNARTNNSGFSALPGGRRGDYGDFTPYVDRAFFWSATELNTDNAYFRFLFDDVRIFRDSARKQNGLSIRCLKD